MTQEHDSKPLSNVQGETSAPKTTRKTAAPKTGKAAAPKKTAPKAAKADDSKAAAKPEAPKATAAAKVTDASRRKAGMTHLSGQRVEWIGANPGSAIACDNSCYRV